MEVAAEPAALLGPGVDQPLPRPAKLRRQLHRLGGHRHVHRELPQELEIGRGEGIPRASGRQAQLSNSLALVGEGQAENAALFGLSARAEDFAGAKRDRGIG